MSNIKFSGDQSATAINNNFIDNYMASAPSPVFSLVYIYALRCASSGIMLSNGDIASKLNILESDVIKAWKHWKKAGIINIRGTKESPEIEFVSFTKISPESEKKEQKPKVIVSFPVYNPKDIAGIIEENPEVKDLLKAAESIKGKPLSPKETEVIVWMYQSLELPFDVVFLLLSFCYNNGKPARYMEKTAMDWAEKGILTREAASNYLSFYNNYGKVLKFFGVSDRAATQTEKNYVDKWLTEWNLSLELVELAASRTVDNTGKVAFSYCNKILERWYGLSLTTVEEVEKNDEEYKNNRPSPKNKTARLEPPKGVFNNYNQKVYTEEEIKEILRRKAANNNG